MLTISLISGKSFDAADGISILEASASSTASLPYSCKTGRCSTCKCKVIQGETKALQEEIGLTNDEKNDGWILSCVRTPITNIILDVEDLDGISLPAEKTIPCRISSLEKLAVDVLRVRLRLPPSSDFIYIPGQYIDIIGSGGVRRSYSLATVGSVDKLLELHVRAVDGGAMSDYWFNHAKVNDLLRLNGPLGTFFLRPYANQDLIFLATGTGFAPVNAMLASLSELAPELKPKTVSVFWGGRKEDDLYLECNNIQNLCHFVPVLSRPSENWTGAKGHVQYAALADTPDLSNAAVYACGSNAMIQSAKIAFMKAGLPVERFYSDAFVCSATK